MKTECIKLEGTIVSVLPDANFEIKLKNAPNIRSICYLSGKLGKGFSKPEVRDIVLAEFSPTDLTKGRIIKILTK